MSDEPEMWLGGKGPFDFPHRCPFRVSGVSPAECVELSGVSCGSNLTNCFGTERGTVKFPPCNSAVRRCLKCMEEGRFGKDAYPVVDFENGTCPIHKEGESLLLLFQSEGGESAAIRVHQIMQKIETITGKSLLLLEYLSLDLGNVEIRQYMKLSRDSLQTLLSRTYQALGIEGSYGSRKRQIAAEAARYYFRIRPSRRSLAAEVTTGLNVVQLEPQLVAIARHVSNLLKVVRTSGGGK